MFQWIREHTQKICKPKDWRDFSDGLTKLGPVAAGALFQNNDHKASMFALGVGVFAWVCLKIAGEKKDD